MKIVGYLCIAYAVGMCLWAVAALFKSPDIVTAIFATVITFLCWLLAGVGRESIKKAKGE